MLFAEALGIEMFKERVKIYATDVDEEALAHARHGTYSMKDVRPIPPDLLDRYLEPVEDSFTFKKDLRRSVIFGRHDLVQDAPISRVDLVICRNTLMYFNAEVQSAIDRHFHFALNPGGFLFLGKSEMLLTRTDIFVPVDLKRRLFSKRSSVDEQQSGRRHSHGGSAEVQRGGEAPLHQSVFESSHIPQVVVDAAGTLVGANAEARSRLSLVDSDVGRLFSDLRLSYQPAESRSRIEQVMSQHRPLVERSVRGAPSDSDEATFYDIQISPLLTGDQPGGVIISFTDVTESSILRHELERSRQELETTYEEIQSTVEELETTNEKLQSTNDELETINGEFRERTAQLNDANAYLEAVLSSLQTGVVVIDPDLVVRGWNTMAYELWGLQAEEVTSKHLLALDLGLPVDSLRDPIRLCLSGSSSYEKRVLDATNRRGQSFSCKVSCAPTRGSNDDLSGVILLMEPVPQTGGTP